MTAIVGFNYLDGALMLADTEETLGTDAKSECDKLSPFNFVIRCNGGKKKVGIVLTGGAGDSHMIEYANQELAKFLASGLDESVDIIGLLNEFARRFFKESMVGFAGLDYRMVPSLEMLIAIAVEPTSMLLYWKENRIIAVPPFDHVSIGSGVVQTHPRLRDLDRYSGTLETMLWHGVQMMHHAKRAVAGVGGQIEAIALHRDGTRRHFGTDTTRAIEDLIVNFEEFMNKFVCGSVFNVSDTVAAIDENVDSFLGDLPGIFCQYREAYRTILKPKNKQPSGSEKKRRPGKKRAAIVQGER